MIHSEYFKDCRSNRHKPLRIVLFIIAGIMLAAIVSLLLGFAVQLLWNMTITSIFDVKPITFWQSVGILILSRLLFGSIGSHGHRRHPADHVHSGFGSKLREKFHSKFHNSQTDREVDTMPDDETLDQYLNNNTEKKGD